MALNDFPVGAKLSMRCEWRITGVLTSCRFDIPLVGTTALVGDSGSGKTTFLDMVAGIKRPEGGGIYCADVCFFDGVKNFSLPLRQRGLGYVMQQPALMPHMTVMENIGLAAAHRKIFAGWDGGIFGLFEKLGLNSIANQRASKLSGGECRRVALAQSLASDPKILLLDEPMTGLDKETKLRTMAFLKEVLVRSAIPAFYVSHHSDEIEYFANRQLRFSEGRVELLEFPGIG